ncbi:MAG: helix-turn-helix transcriptional regulator [Kofleriaceae bacterium]|nr:helix-turn-helix transcriptional regulator [Kofleriaceae bacterium]
MKKTLQFKDWEKNKLILVSDARREIVDRCRSQALSIQDLAIAMALNPGSIHNHVHKLHDAGFLVVESTREINGITERKYRRSAAFFSLFEVAPKDVAKRNKNIAQLAGKRVTHCLAYGKKPIGLFDVNIRVSEKKLAVLGALAEKLRLAILDADGSGNIPVSSFLVLGKTPKKDQK